MRDARQFYSCVMTVFICRIACWKKRSHRSSHSMLANFCTVLFMFFKATAVGSVAPRLPEAQCNWFGGRSTVASPSVKNVLGSIFFGGRSTAASPSVLELEFWIPRIGCGGRWRLRFGGANLLRLLMYGRRRCGRRIAGPNAVAEAYRGHDGRIAGTTDVLVTYHGVSRAR